MSYIPNMTGIMNRVVKMRRNWHTYSYAEQLTGLKWLDFAIDHMRYHDGYDFEGYDKRSEHQDTLDIRWFLNHMHGG